MLTSKQVIALLQGAGSTLQLTLLAIVFGIVLGLFLALGRISRNKIINTICWIYIWIFRGTPLLLQILVVYYALPQYGIMLDAFPSAIIALSLNSGAYLAETIRAAIQSIDKGQMEASKALGMSYYQAMFKVIIPQSYRRLIPPVGNEMIMLLKDSSLVSAIGMAELLRNAKVMANSSADAVFYVYAAVIYLFFTSLLTLMFQRLEKRYSIYE
ncbi:MAG: yecS [Clostridia bacterium]|nr:yecS [Clostridia bacterium]